MATGKFLLCNSLTLFAYLSISRNSLQMVLWGPKLAKSRAVFDPIVAQFCSILTLFGAKTPFLDS